MCGWRWVWLVVARCAIAIRIGTPEKVWCYTCKVIKRLGRLGRLGTLEKSPLSPLSPLSPQRSCRLAQAKQTQTLRAAHPNFSGEVVRCGASQKKPLRDSTHSTALSGLIFWDGPQIAAYREKLISCQKGLDLFYRKRRGLRIVLKRTASDLLLLGWDKDMPLITRNSRNYSCFFKASRNFSGKLLLISRSIDRIILQMARAEELPWPIITGALTPITWRPPTLSAFIASQKSNW